MVKVRRLGAVEKAQLFEMGIMQWKGVSWECFICMTAGAKAHSRL